MDMGYDHWYTENSDNGLIWYDVFHVVFVVLILAIAYQIVMCVDLTQWRFENNVPDMKQ